MGDNAAHCRGVVSDFGQGFGLWLQVRNSNQWKCLVIFSQRCLLYSTLETASDLVSINATLDPLR
jgi:hypothetical protein